MFDAGTDEVETDGAPELTGWPAKSTWLAPGQWETVSKPRVGGTEETVLKLLL